MSRSTMALSTKAEGRFVPVSVVEELVETASVASKPGALDEGRFPFRPDPRKVVDRVGARQSRNRSFQGPRIRASTAKVPPAGAAEDEVSRGVAGEIDDAADVARPAEEEPKARAVSSVVTSRFEQTEAQPAPCLRGPRRPPPSSKMLSNAGDAEADRVQPARPPRRNHAALDPEVERRPAALEGEIEGQPRFRATRRSSTAPKSAVRSGRSIETPDAARRVFREGREGEPLRVHHVGEQDPEAAPPSAPSHRRRPHPGNRGASSTVTTPRAAPARKSSRSDRTEPLRKSRGVVEIVELVAREARRVAAVVRKPPDSG